MANAGPTSPRATSIRSATTALAVGPAPAPAPGEEQPPGEIALGDDGVERAGDVRQRVGERHEARVDALEQGAVDLLGERDELDPEAERRGMVEVDARDVADALGGDMGEIEPRTEGDRREDAQLVRRVDAVDVEARVGLGEPEPLGVGEDGGELSPSASIRVRM